MRPSRRDRCVSWIARIRFETQDREVSEGVVATPRSGGGDMGTRGHNACQLSFPVLGWRYVFLVIRGSMTVAYACDLMCVCVGISRQTSFKGGRMYNPGKLEIFGKMAK